MPCTPKAIRKTRKAETIGKRKFYKVGSRYGAPMGRIESKGDLLHPWKFRLSKIAINKGGYDAGGAYWGIGQPVYCAAAGETEFYTRAVDRDAAKAEVIRKYPNATFYR